MAPVGKFVGPGGSSAGGALTSSALAASSRLRTGAAHHHPRFTAQGRVGAWTPTPRHGGAGLRRGPKAGANGGSFAGTAGHVGGALWTFRAWAAPGDDLGVPPVGTPGGSRTSDGGRVETARRGRAEAGLATDATSKARRAVARDGGSPRGGRCRGCPVGGDRSEPLEPNGNRGYIPAARVPIRVMRPAGPGVSRPAGSRSGGRSGPRPHLSDGQGPAGRWSRYTRPMWTPQGLPADRRRGGRLEPQRVQGTRVSVCRPCQQSVIGKSQLR